MFCPPFKLFQNEHLVARPIARQNIQAYLAYFVKIKKGSREGTMCDPGKCWDGILVPADGDELLPEPMLPSMLRGKCRNFINILRLDIF